MRASPGPKKTSAAKQFDWEQAKARATVLLHDGQVERELERVFRERARALSSAEHEHAQSQGGEHLRFRVGPFSFGLKLDSISSVLRPSWLTKIPGAPRHLSRVIHVEGRIVAVLDLAAWLGTELGNDEQSWRVLLVEHGRQRVGVLASAVRDIASLDLAELSVVTTQQSQVAGFVHGATHDMTLVLDAGRLIAELRGNGGRVAL